MSRPDHNNSSLYGTSTHANTPTWSSSYHAWQLLHNPHLARPSTPPTNPEHQTLHSSIALSSAFEAFKLFISASRLLPQELAHEVAIGKLISIVDEEVEREGGERGLSGADRERAVYEARKAVRGMYEEWYVTGLELERFLPGKENWRVVEVLG